MDESLNTPSLPRRLGSVGLLLVIGLVLASPAAWSQWRAPLSSDTPVSPVETAVGSSGGLPGLPRTAPSRVAILDADNDPPPRSPVDKKRGIDALLEDDNLEERAPPAVRLFGFDQFEAAYTLPSPGHLSKLTNRIEVGAQGGLTPEIKWKVSGRFDYNAVYDVRSFYPSQVKDDQRFNATFRETYVDVGAGDLDFRVGRQQIIWGEVVGLFVADVVSAKDLRETIVMDFDLLRIPQWAARAEYFKNEIHLEAIFIPFPSVNKIGKPGSDFFPYPPPPPPGYGYVINNEVKPEENGSKRNYGVRGSFLRAGWDVAAFGYRSVDASPTFYRQVVQSPRPAFIYTPRHTMITQYGTTVSKDFENFLFKAEGVYTVGQNFNVTRLSDSDGVVGQNYFDYIFSLEFPLANEARFNAQVFQRIFKNHDADILPRRVESGVTLFWSGKWTSRVEPQILAIHSLNRNDWLLRPKIVWNVKKDWRAIVGADIFGGSATGLFGQYDKQDRAYVEVRKSF